MVSKVLMYQDGTTADSMKLGISQTGRHEEYTAGNIDFDVLNSLKSDNRPVSMRISGYYDDYGSEILHSMRVFFEKVGDEIFDNMSYRLRYTEDGSTPCTFDARKMADGSAFRGMVKAHETVGIPEVECEFADSAITYYRKREGKNFEGIEPLVQKLSKLSLDNSFSMDKN